MDWQKIINDLKARALSTLFDNERDICLKKIQKLKISMGLDPEKKTENNVIKSLPIEELRRIFTETYCSWYLKDKIYYSETNTILYQFDRYNLHYIFEERYKLDLNPDVSLKMLKYRKSIRDWAFEEYQYISSLSNNLQDFYYFNYYVEVDKGFAFWCLPSYKFTGIASTIKSLNDEFNRKKKEFFEKLNSGYYDRMINDLFDPKLLED